MATTRIVSGFSLALGLVSTASLSGQFGKSRATSRLGRLHGRRVFESAIPRARVRWERALVFLGPDMEGTGSARSLRAIMLDPA